MTKDVFRREGELTDMITHRKILGILADGKFHSGTAIGARLGVTRAAVSKAVKSLVADGVEIYRVTGRGYRLPDPLTLLDRGRIQRALGERGRKRPASVDVYEQLDSTSLELLRRARTEDVHGRVVVAESQTAGRGRRGRGWVATPYRNVMLSLAWRFEAGSAALGGLSLAAGVAVLRALRAFGIEDIALKWPNDVLWLVPGGAQARKLAGLLIDVRGETAGPLLAVIGLGLNVRLDAGAAERIAQPWAALSDIAGTAVDRNRLIAAVVGELIAAMRRFDAKGFPAFKDEWQRHHFYHRKHVGLARPDSTVTRGTVTGVDEHGALLVSDARGRVHAFHSGEISVRLAE